MSGLVFNQGHWPVGFVRLVGHLSDSDVEGLLAAFESCLTRAEASPGASKFVMVFDLTEMKAPNAAQRSRYAEFMNDNRERLTPHMLSTVIMLRSKVIRGMLTAINWITPFPIPPCFVADFAQAEKEAQRFLRDAGIAWRGRLAEEYQVAV